MKYRILVIHKYEHEITRENISTSRTVHENEEILYSASNLIDKPKARVSLSLI